MNTLHQVWEGIQTSLSGMQLTLKYFFRKPVTQMYPHLAKAPVQSYRGFQAFRVEDCIACNLCVKICPVDCIELDAERVKVGGKLTPFLTHYEINFETCMFCGLCEEVCPTECIVMGPDHLLYADASGREKGQLIKEYVNKEEALSVLNAAKIQAARELAAVSKPEADHA